MTLALKHRPKTFDEVIGQQIPKRVVQSHIKAGVFPPGYLFEGKTGSGKTTLAYLVSKRLLCDSPIGVDPCNNCESCRLVEESSHPNFLYVDATSQRSIDDVKGIMLRHLDSAPVYGTYRILIVDEAHQMARASVSPFLTQLEHMPKRSLVIFCTTESAKILPELRDRCSSLTFQPIPARELGRSVAKQYPETSVELLELLAALCGGSSRKLWAAIENWQTMEMELTEQLVWKLVHSVSTEERMKFWTFLSKKRIKEVVSTWESWLMDSCSPKQLGSHLIDDLVSFATYRPDDPLYPKALALLSGIRYLGHDDSWLPALLSLSGVSIPVIESPTDHLKIGKWLYV